MSLRNTGLTDTNFFMGSANLTLALVLSRDPTDLTASVTDITAEPEPYAPNAFSFCAHTADPARACAAASKEAFSNIWVPPPGRVWGRDYTIRVVASTGYISICVCPCVRMCTCLCVQIYA